MRRIPCLVFGIALLADSAGAADEAKTKRAHNVPLAFFLSAVDGAADEAAIKDAVQKVKSVSAIDFNSADGYVRIIFDSHVVSYHQVAQAIIDAGSKTGKKYDPRLKVRVPEYATGDNAKKVNTVLEGKRLNQRVRIETVDKTQGDFVVHFLPLVLDATETGPQGFNGGHLNHPIHDPSPRGLGLTCIYEAGKAPVK